MNSDEQRDADHAKETAPRGSGGLPEPVQAALADRTFMEGVRAAMAETDPPVPLKQIQARERAERAQRRV